MYSIGSTPWDKGVKAVVVAGVPVPVIIADSGPGGGTVNVIEVGRVVQ